MTAKHDCSVGGNILRRTLVPVAAAMALVGAVGINSASADFSYNSYTWTGEDVSILTPEAVNGGAGQIQLHNSNTGQTLLAWCLDIYDWLQGSGTYAINPSGTIYNHTTQINLSVSTASHIGGLMVEGNQLIAAGGPGIFWNGVQYSVADESAAIQLAIWQAEYGSAFTYNHLIDTHPNFDQLVTHLDGLAGSSGYSNLDPDPANCYTSGCPADNQHLAFVPGPLAGTGLPGLMAACAALIGFARRRRRAVA